jgi:hypothetical protein
MATLLCTVCWSCGSAEAPADPSPEPPDPIKLGTVVVEDGVLSLTLEASCCAESEILGFGDNGISLYAEVQNKGSAPVFMDLGGCGCLPIALELLPRGAGSCEADDPLCPCWSEPGTLRVGKDLGSYRAFYCSATEAMATARFPYEIESGGLSHTRAIEARIEFDLPAGRELN